MKRRLIRKGRIDASAVAAEVDDEIIAQVRGTAPAGETLGTLREALTLSVDAFLSDTSTTLNDGDYVSAGTHRYRIVADDAATGDWLVETAGGKRAVLLPGPRGYDLTALGWKADSDSDAANNSAIIKRLSDYCEANGSLTAYVPAPTSEMTLDYWPLDERLHVHSSDNKRLTIEGEGAASHMRVVRTSGSSGGQMALLNMGNFKASGQAGQNLLGGTSYAIDDISKGDHLITLTTPAESSNFSVGMPIRIWAASIYTTYSPYARLDIIESIDVGTGVIRLRYPSSHDATNVVIAPGDGSDTSLTDWNSDVSRMVVGLTMRNVGVSVAHPTTGIFQLGANLECRIENIHIFEAHQAFSSNGWAHCHVSGVTGKVQQKAVNAAYFSHDSVFENIRLSCGSYQDTPTGTVQNVVQCEENAYNIKVINSHFVVGGNGLLGYAIRFTKACSHCLVKGCRFTGYGPYLYPVFYTFPNDDGYPKNNNDVEDCYFDAPHASDGIIGVSMHANQYQFDINSHIKTCEVNAYPGAVIANANCTGLHLDNIKLPNGGDDIRQNAPGASRNRFTNIYSSEEIDISVLQGLRPIVKGVQGPSAEYFLSGAISGNSVNSNSTTVDNVLDQAVFGAYGSGPVGSIKTDDSIRIRYSGNADDSAGGNKHVKVRLLGTSTKVFAVTFTGAESGLFLIDITVSVRSNMTCRIQGYTLKETTISAINETMTLNPAADNSIEIVGYVADASDNLDAQWHVEPRRFGLT